MNKQIVVAGALAGVLFLMWLTRTPTSNSSSTTVATPACEPCPTIPKHNQHEHSKHEHNKDEHNKHKQGHKNKQGHKHKQGHEQSPWGSYSEAGCGDISRPERGLAALAVDTHGDEPGRRTVFMSKTEKPFKWVVSNAATDSNAKNVKALGFWDEPAVNSFIEVGMAKHPVVRGEEPPLFVDLGANLGFYTLWMLSSGYRTLSVEVQPELGTNLLASIGLNSGFADRARLYNHPIADECGQVFDINFNSANSGATNIRDGAKGSGTVKSAPSVTLEALLAGLDVTFMKIDVEGFEAKVILSAPEFFHSDRAPLYLVMELNVEWIGIPDLDALYALLTDAGYKYCNEEGNVSPWVATAVGTGSTTWWVKGECQPLSF